MNTYRNIWAVVCPARPEVGATVKVTTKGGKVKPERISAVVGKCDDGWICTTGEPLDDATQAGEAVRLALGRERAENRALVADNAKLRAALAGTAKPEPVTVDVTPEPDAAPAAPESSGTPPASDDGNTALAKPDPVQTARKWATATDGSASERGPFSIGPGAFRVQL